MRAITMRANNAYQQCGTLYMFNGMNVLAGTADSVGAVRQRADEHLPHVPAGQPLLDETDAVDVTG